MNSREVCKRAGITYRQLHYWTAQGYLTATADGTGSGYDRDYPDAEALKAVLMGDLICAGLTPHAAHVTARDLLGDGTARLGDRLLLVRVAP